MVPFLVPVDMTATPAAVFATDYTVGDANGWSQGVDYTTWTSGKTFSVGDNLVFNYGPTHGVDVVGKSDYDSCGTSNAIETFTGGSTTYPLNKTGAIYFICPTGGHCTSGMKLAVTVSGSSSGNGPSGSPPTGGSGSGSGTPTTNDSPPSPAGGGGSNDATNALGSLMLVAVSLVFGVMFV